MAAACLLPGSAFAVEYRTVTESFGPDGTSGTSFSYPTALAFDQGNKRLYANDRSTSKLHGFDSSTPGTHPPLGGSFPLSLPGAGFNEDVAVNSSSHNFYYVTPGASKGLYGFDQSGAALSGFSPSGFSSPCGVAVDSSGNIWVADSSEIKEFSSAGALLKTIPAGAEVCDLAFDSAGNLYAVVPYEKTLKFTAASSYASSSVFDSEPTVSVDVDKSTGEVLMVHFSFETFTSYVNARDTSGAFLYEFAGGLFEEFGGIAVDESTHEAYVADDSSGKVLLYSKPASLPKLTTGNATAITGTEAIVHGTINPQEQVVEDCHFEVVPASQFQATGYSNVTGAEEIPCVPAAGSIPADANDHAVSAGVTGLTPATLYHYRLVATNPIGEAQGLDRVFTSGPAAPLIEEQSVEVVGTAEATVAAKIKPRGGSTTYFVEYGTTGAYGQSTPESAPLGFPTDNTTHTVSVHIGGLTPGAAYHFRFVASNEAGVAEGGDTTFATYQTTPPFGSCPNDQFRTGPGARLPDCRAYEQVTPIDKHGSNAQGKIGYDSASIGGDHVVFFANGGLPTSGGSANLAPFMASRGPTGWSTDGLLPPTGPGQGGQIREASEDFSTVLTEGPGPGGVGRALYLRDSRTAVFQPVVTAAHEFEALFSVSFADDTSHLIFTTRNQLLPSAPFDTINLYDLDHGVITLVNRVPSGSATSCDDEAGPACVVPAKGSEGTGQISADGSRVFFNTTAPGNAPGIGRLYMREDGVRTTWISASQRTTPDPNGEKPTERVDVTADGSKVFFTSCEKLTDDSTAVSNGENSCDQEKESGLAHGSDLYSYDVETGELTDLTVDSNAGDPVGAGVKGVIGISNDGSYVYFSARGALAPGASNGSNLYVYHDGVIKLIAQAGVALGHQGYEPFGARVATDGSAVVFSRMVQLTHQFFRYSAPEEKLVCISCSLVGRPLGDAQLGGGGQFVSESLPGSRSRNLSSDGNRFFFESPDALVPGDTDGVYDVYEWEAKGTGSCESESQNGGCLYLISTGTSSEPAQFLDSSGNGDHVFFFIEQQLVPTDQDQLVDVYDAAVGGGLAAQHALTPPTCASTACQANPPPPPDQTPASATFSGPGNAHPTPSARRCPKGKRKVRRAGKVRCQKARKQHKRHNNRGGAK